jgi:hypothetical protein
VESNVALALSLMLDWLPRTRSWKSQKEKESTYKEYEIYGYI